MNNYNSGAEKIINRLFKILFTIFILATSCLAAHAQDTVVPLPEHYISDGQTSKYIEDAYGYLQRNPTSNMAPRVALDILMVAERFGNKELSDIMKVFLMFEHSQSLQSVHVLSTFKDVDEFRAFVMVHAQEQLAKNHLLFPLQFSRLVDSGMFHFKNDIMNDGEFLLIAYCLANAAGATKTDEVLLPALKEKAGEDANLAKLVDICLNNKITVSEKVIRLHKQEENIPLLNNYYLSTLTASEKKEPDISLIIIGNAVKSGNYETAMLQLQAMPESFLNDPRILFWKSWIQFALKNDEEALETLSGLIKKFPKSEWVETAKLYMQGISSFKTSKDDNAKALLACFDVLREGIGFFEAKINFITNPDKHTKESHLVYAGLIPDKNILELMLYKNNKMVIGYRTGSADSALYLDGNDKILSFNESAAIPVPTLSLDREKNGNFLFNAGLEFSSSIKDAGVKTSTLFNSKYLSTFEGINDLLEHIARRHGWVPVKPLTKKEITTYIWHIPSTDSPDLKQVEYRISQDNIITSFNYDSLYVDDLRYGKKASFKLNAPSWPGHPEQKNEKFDFSIWMKFMGAAMGLFQSDK